MTDLGWGDSGLDGCVALSGEGASDAVASGVPPGASRRTTIAVTAATAAPIARALLVPMTKAWFAACTRAAQAVSCPGGGVALVKAGPASTWVASCGGSPWTADATFDW